MQARTNDRTIMSSQFHIMAWAELGPEPRYPRIMHAANACPSGRDAPSTGKAGRLRSGSSGAGTAGMSACGRGVVCECLGDLSSAALVLAGAVHKQRSFVWKQKGGDRLICHHPSAFMFYPSTNVALERSSYAAAAEDAFSIPSATTSDRTALMVNPDRKLRPLG